MYRRLLAAGAAVLFAAATLAGASTAQASDEPSPIAPPAEAAEQLLVSGGIPSDELPADTVNWLASKIESGTAVKATASSTYSSQNPNTPPGTISTLGYETAPCYLTVITEYEYASPKWVDNDSFTGCTEGLAETVRHDMQLIKRDTVFGTTSLVAEDGATGGPGGFESSVKYGCPNDNNSDFQGDTAGEILYGGTYYYAEGNSGDYDNYDCG
jgi:hypothetical protein